MPHTTFEQIYNLFLNSLSNDYQITKLFKDAPEIAEDLLKTWLMQAVAKFSDCRIDLENSIDFNNSSFTDSLTLTEQVILGDLMVLSWIEYHINNITQMNLSVQDRDFKTHAEERNLAGKVEYHDRWREKVYHEISEYTKKLYPIASWFGGGN